MPKKVYLDVYENLTLGGGREFEGRVIDMIDRFKGYVEKYGEDVYISYETGWYDDDPEYVLRWTRKETDEERDARLAAKRKEREAAAARLEKIKEERRKMYEELKREFEK